jgi:hypothetical protein
VGTRYEDQPPEHWAGPESLDPTPVWKQFALIGSFLSIGLIVLAGVGLVAAAPQLAKPPALVFGGRLVLPLSALPPNNIGGAGVLPEPVGPPLIDESHRFWLGRVDSTEVIAIRAVWSPGRGLKECPVHPSTVNGRVGFVAFCESPAGGLFSFDGRGNPVERATRGLDQYLVSVSSDRVVVNLDRLIVALERSSPPPSPSIVPPGQ